MAISKGTLTGVARTLEGRGLIRRADDPSDGRLVLLSLTEEGQQQMQERRQALLDGAAPAPRRSIATPSSVRAGVPAVTWWKTRPSRAAKTVSAVSCGTSKQA